MDEQGYVQSRNATAEVGFWAKIIVSVVYLAIITLALTTFWHTARADWYVTLRGFVLSLTEGGVADVFALFLCALWWRPGSEE